MPSVQPINQANLVASFHLSLRMGKHLAETSEVPINFIQENSVIFLHQKSSTENVLTGYPYLYTLHTSVDYMQLHNLAIEGLGSISGNEVYMSK